MDPEIAREFAADQGQRSAKAGRAPHDYDDTVYMFRDEGFHAEFLAELHEIYLNAHADEKYIRSFDPLVKIVDRIPEPGRTVALDLIAKLLSLPGDGKGIRPEGGD
jgi:hypothetical protein